MKAEAEAFDPHPGRGFGIAPTWLGTRDGLPGKTTRDADTVQGPFRCARARRAPPEDHDAELRSSLENLAAFVA